MWIVLLLTLLFLFIVGYIKSYDTGLRGNVPMLLTQTESALATLQTGDLIFTKARNFTSKLQQFAFGSYVNHCAMVVRVGESNLWIWDLAPDLGAYVAPLQDFILSNWNGRSARPHNPATMTGRLHVPYVVPHDKSLPSALLPFEQSRASLFIRRLKKPLDTRTVVRCIERNLGRPYSYRFWMGAFTKFTGLDFGFGWGWSRDSLGMFCTELIAHTYLDAGAFAVSPSQPPESLMPFHFWEDQLPWKSSDGYGFVPFAERLVGPLHA